jgi:hypothetical protein
MSDDRATAQLRKPVRVSVVGLCVVTALAALGWVLVVWPVPMGSDPRETMDGAPSSTAAAMFYLTLSVAILSTAVAAFGWWWRTRSRTILVVGLVAIGFAVFGAAFTVMFILPFL